MAVAYFGTLHFSTVLSGAKSRNISGLQTIPSWVCQSQVKQLASETVSMTSCVDT